MSNSWLIYSLLSAFFAGLVAVFGKIGLQGLDTNTATAVRAVIMAVFLIIVIGFQGKFDHVAAVFGNHKALTFIVLSGVAGALSWLCYFLALKRGLVAQVAAVDRLSIIFALLLAFILLKEKVSLIALLGILFMAAGTVLVALG